MCIHVYVFCSQIRPQHSRRFARRKLRAMAVRLMFARCKGAQASLARCSTEEKAALSKAHADVLCSQLDHMNDAAHRVEFRDALPSLVDLVSEICLDDADRDRVFDALTRLNAIKPRKSARGAMQNYRGLLQYFSANEWEVFTDATSWSCGKAMNLFLSRAIALGCRTPSEPTTHEWTAFAVHQRIGLEGACALGPLGLSAEHSMMKKRFKSMAGSAGDAPENCDTLPVDPMECKEKFKVLWEIAFPAGSENPTWCKANLQQVVTVNSLWKCRGNMQIGHAYHEMQHMMFAHQATMPMRKQIYGPNSMSFGATGGMPMLTWAPTSDGESPKVSPRNSETHGKLHMMHGGELAMPQLGASTRCGVRVYEHAMRPSVEDREGEDGNQCVGNRVGAQAGAAASRLDELDQLAKDCEAAGGAVGMDAIVGAMGNKLRATPLLKKPCGARQVAAGGKSASSAKVKAKIFKRPSSSEKYEPPRATPQRTRSEIACRPGSQKLTGLKGHMVKYGKGQKHVSFESAMKEAMQWVKRHS